MYSIAYYFNFGPKGFFLSFLIEVSLFDGGDFVFLLYFYDLFI